MRPLYIGGCLAWYHSSSGFPGQPTLGVVLCPALGREARWTLRTMRQLADRLAVAGLPTLRFEYSGTGESADLPEWEDPFAAWQDNVHSAIDWLRARTGLDRVALCGLRFGALLAARAAASRHDVAALAMLAPVLSGRAYARELRMTSAGAENEPAPADGIEVEGSVLSNATLHAMGAVDLTRATAAPCEHILLLDPDQRSGPYAERMRKLFAQVTVLPFPGHAELMRIATSNLVPHAALDSVSGWLAAMASAQGARPAPPPRPMHDDCVLLLPGCSERALQFGPGGRLAGVLCEPAGQPDHRAAAARLGVLITNTGGDPRAGIARFAVLLSRRLAAEGMASLRLDFAGLGDSTLESDVDGHLYETNRAPDIAAGLNLLQGRGYRVGAAGLCAGAYHLLHAAPAEPRIENLVLINLVTFAWRTGDMVEVAQRALARSNSRYRQMLLDPLTWRRVGRGEIHLRHLARTFLIRFWQALARAGARALGVLGVETSLEWPRRCLRALLGRGTRLLVLSGVDDPGVATLEANFGRYGRALAAVPGATVWIEPGLDHTLSRRFMQERVAKIIVDFLAERLPAA